MLSTDQINSFNRFRKHKVDSKYLMVLQDHIYLYIVMHFRKFSPFVSLKSTSL